MGEKQTGSSSIRASYCKYLMVNDTTFGGWWCYNFRHNFSMFDFPCFSLDYPLLVIMQLSQYNIWFKYENNFLILDSSNFDLSLIIFVNTWNHLWANQIIDHWPLIKLVVYHWPNQELTKSNLDCLLYIDFLI